MVRLEGYDQRKPAQLSGGQRQRVALARALVNRPRVLLLDEPLGALDLKLREEMQIELNQIQHDVGITFIYVTHDQEEALTMSDRIAVFNAGRIEQVGTPAEVYERPATAFVAGFVGTSNVLVRGVGRGDPRARRARSPSAPRRSSSRTPRRSRPTPPRRTIVRRGRPDPERRLPRPGHAYHVDARRRGRARGHPAEPRDDLDRGARPAGARRPARLETAAHPGDRRGVGPGVRDLEEEHPSHAQNHPDPGGHRRPGRIRLFERRRRRRRRRARPRASRRPRRASVAASEPAPSSASAAPSQAAASYSTGRATGRSSRSSRRST